MNPFAKLAGFTLVMAVVFGSAAVAGSRIDVHPGNPGTRSADTPRMGEMAGAPGHGGDASTTTRAVRGLAVSEGGLTLKLARNTASAGKRLDLAFRVVDRRGQTVRDFDVEHTKRMHFIVVRRDMTGFQHLHPTQLPDGTWSVRVTLPDAGSYRVFADFSVNGKPHTLADDVTVDGTVRSHELPDPSDSLDVDGLHVSRTGAATKAGAESELAFGVTRNGKPVAVQDYLGAEGHLVALRRGDLAFLHVHPDEHSLKFMAAFPTAGPYRLFLQFKTDGRLHTAAFTQEVPR